MWYFESTELGRYIPPAQHSYDYDRVGVACGGRRVGGGSAGGKSMLKPSLPEACPLVGLENPLDSLAVCAVYLPGGRERVWVNSQSTNSVDLNTIAPNLPCYMTMILLLFPPNVDLLSNWLHS